MHLIKVEHRWFETNLTVFLWLQCKLFPILSIVKQIGLKVSKLGTCKCELTYCFYLILNYLTEKWNYDVWNTKLRKKFPETLRDHDWKKKINASHTLSAKIVISKKKLEAKPSRHFFYSCLIGSEGIWIMHTGPSKTSSSNCNWLKLFCAARKIGKCFFKLVLVFPP